MKIIKIQFLILVSLFLSFSSTASKLQCRIEHYFHSDSHLVTTTYFLHLSGDRGVIKMDGIYNDKTQKQIISREIHVHVKSENGLLTLKSKKIIRFPVETINEEIIQKEYPALFSQNGKMLSLTMVRADKKSIILSYNAKSFYYCKG